jgi:diamine N-acetyltransferase
MTMLTGKRIKLRPLRREDLKHTMKWRNDPEIKASAMMHPFPVSPELEEEWFSGLQNTGNRAVWFAIEPVEGNAPIGFIFLNNIRWVERNCCLGILIGEKTQQGSGIGREAMDLVIGYAFKALNLRKISLEVRTDNKAALLLYEKTGFRKEGTLRDHYYSAGKYHDALILSLFNPGSPDGR